jgi:carbon-monoxide dehydrogenase medium subunit
LFVFTYDFFNKIQKKENEIIIGAGVTFSDIIKSELLNTYLPLLCDSAKKVASVGIRNRATLAGNICSAVPSLDSAPALLIYDAKVIVEDTNGTNEIDIHKWFVAPKKTILKSNQLVTAIKIKIPQVKHYATYEKHGRYRGEDLAQAGIGIYLDEENKIKLAFCAVGPIPKRLSATEKFLCDKKITDEVIEEASQILDTEISPISDIRASEKYRRHIMKIMFKRGLNKLLKARGGEL